MTDAKVLRVGVVGCGYFGEKHARVFHSLANTQLMAVCDTNKAQADALAARLGCNAYASVGEMLQKEELDACSVAVSEQYHLTAAAPILKAKKHLLIEKPIAQNAAEGQELLRLAQENGVRLMVGQILKFDPKYQTLAERIAAGELGSITNMYLKRTSTNGVPQRLKGTVSMYHYMGVHDFEAMLTFAGEAKVKRVYTQGVSRVNAPYNAGDATLNTITFDNGCIACIHLCWSLPNDALGLVTCAHVVGTKGVGYVDIHSPGLAIYGSGSTVEYPEMTYWPEANGEIQGALRAELAHFADCTLHEKPYIVDSARALEAVRVIDACRESLKTGQPVEL